MLIVVVIVALDHFLYRVLALVVRFGQRDTIVETASNGTASQPHAAFGGEHTLRIAVRGEGPIAEMIREILDFRFTKTVHEELSNQMCLTRPRPPDWSAVVVWLVIPLLVMLLLQVRRKCLNSK